MRLRDIPIRRKLMMSLLLTSGVVLFLACTAFITYEVITLRKGMVDAYATRAAIIAANSSAALAFQNEADATEVLGALKTDPRITMACLYDRKGNVFAKYPADALTGAFPDASGESGYRAGHLETFRLVVQDGRILGTVYLKSELSALAEHYRAYAWLSAAIIVGAILVAFLLARALQGQISQPILALAGTARAISTNRDFSVKAPKFGEDELGTLTDAFNRMLDEIHKSEESLRRSEERFRALIENSADGIVVSKAQGQALYVSSALTRMLGVSEEALVGRSREDLIHPDDLDYVMGKMTETLQNPRRVVQARYRLKHKDGSWRWIEMTATNLLDDPAVGGIVRNIRDITDQKRAEELLQSRDVFQISVESIKDYAVLVLDTKGRVMSWNAGAETIKGYKANEVIGKKIEIFYTPEDRARNHPAEFLETARQKGRAEEENWRVRKDGSRFMADVVLTSVLDNAGGLMGFVKVTRDVTEIRKAQDEIKQANEFLNTVLENIPNMIFVKDARELRFVRFNKAGEELLGIPRMELIGKNDYDLFPKDQADFFTGKDRAVLGKGTVLDIPEESIETKTKGSRLLHTKKIPILGQNGDPQYLLGISEDITDQKEQERLRIYAQALEVSNKELQDFVFVASHDLQEPLRKVQSFGEFLLREEGQNLGPNGKDYLDRMRNAAGRMQRLINDLLALTRVTTKAQPFVPVELDKVLREVLGDLETRIRETGAKVQTDPLPTLKADPTQMRQLFQNLVGNALKFHRPGVPPEVRVSAVLEKAGKNGAERCRITVEDNGIGFDNKYAEQIFKVFERLHGKEAYEGTGIGLSICRKVVERHGGTIRAEGIPGQGSRFIVELPMRGKPST